MANSIYIVVHTIFTDDYKVDVPSTIEQISVYSSKSLAFEQVLDDKHLIAYEWFTNRRDEYPDAKKFLDTEDCYEAEPWINEHFETLVNRGKHVARVHDWVIKEVHGFVSTFK